MGKRARKKSSQPALSTAAQRVTWLLEHVWDGNRSAMARDVSCSPSVLTKIAAGDQSPGRRLLTAISSHPKVNPSWLLAGTGEPLLASSAEVPAAGWPLPIAGQALPGAPSAHAALLTGESFPTAGAFYRPSRYWLEIQPKEPLLRIRQLCLRPRDLLLIETDASWWSQMHMIHERIGVVPTSQDKHAVELGFITQHLPDPDDPCEYLSIELPPEGNTPRQRIVVDRYPDGNLQATERWLDMPLPRSRQVSLTQIVGLCLMIVRR